MFKDFKKYITPPVKETLSANIAAQLKSLIFKKQFVVGDRLPSERELAKIFGVSRVIIKQALLALELSGYIQVKLGAQGGAFITHDYIKPITVCMEDLQHNGELKISHFHEVRRALEYAALQSAIDRISEADLTRLKKINHDFIKAENRHKHGEINIAFHVALAEISGNPLIKILLLSVLETVFNYPGPTISDAFLTKAHDDHESIIEALSSGDVDSAGRLLVQNIDRITIKNI